MSGAPGGAPGGGPGGDGGQGQGRQPDRFMNDSFYHEVHEEETDQTYCRKTSSCIVFVIFVIFVSFVVTNPG
jgi:hypothetical protein